MEKKIPKHWSKQRLLEKAVNFAIRTKRPQDLARKVELKTWKEQVRLTDDQIDKLHKRAEGLGISVGELINRALVEISVDIKEKQNEN